MKIMKNYELKFNYNSQRKTKITYHVKLIINIQNMCSYYKFYTLQALSYGAFVSTIIFLHETMYQVVRVKTVHMII